MEKDFDRWNKQKKYLDTVRPRVDFHEREIWWCSIGVNVGSEQHSQTGDFSRPILIFRKWSGQIFWGIPLTTKIKDINFRYRFLFHSIYNDILITQMRALDVRRLIRKIGVMPENEFEELKLKILTCMLLNEKKRNPVTRTGNLGGRSHSAA
jgi:mRNA interferase MazF